MMELFTKSLKQLNAGKVSNDKMRSMASDLVRFCQKMDKTVETIDYLDLDEE